MNAEEQMQRVSEEIDNFIQNADKNKQLMNYISDYRELWENVFNTYLLAGCSGVIHPKDGLKWLQEQSGKLNGFLNELKS
jgi:hypothetical protein